MVDENTNFFEYTNNFSKTKSVKSICVYKSNLNYKPQVTIAIPTFKRESLLKEAIDSALNQLDYLNFDIIVVDNNPERNCKTEKLLENYKGSKISYYKNSENIMMGGNWNRLFSLASGEYVAVLHDDDYLLPLFLKVGMKIIDSNKDVGLLKPKDLKFSNLKDVNFSEIPNNTNKLKRIYDVTFYYGHIIGAPTGVIYKKENVLSLGGFNQNFFPSLDYCFNVYFAQKYKVFTLDSTLSLYRIGFNESLKESTLKGWAITDYYLIKNLLTNKGLPIFFVKNFLKHRISNTTKENRRLWNNDFVFDLSSIGLTKINPYLGKLYHLGVRIFVKILELKYRLF